mmetsp:Transcript_12067/g.34147  ORF Transcript_12067/g.34147 Transcript_12067/m.34147 type:complete len:238 (+) Transcript_12067:3120-3833(+)
MLADLRGNKLHGDLLSLLGHELHQLLGLCVSKLGEFCPAFEAAVLSLGHAHPLMTQQRTILGIAHHEHPELVLGERVIGRQRGHRLCVLIRKLVFLEGRVVVHPPVQESAHAHRDQIMVGLVFAFLVWLLRSLVEVRPGRHRKRRELVDDLEHVQRLGAIKPHCLHLGHDGLVLDLQEVHQAFDLLLLYELLQHHLVRQMRQLDQRRRPCPRPHRRGEVPLGLDRHRPDHALHELNR